MSAVMLVLPYGSGDEPPEFDINARPSALKDKLRHDNPHWPVSSRADAEKALSVHQICDPLECSTRVAAIIVTRNNFEYFRNRMR
ncbi:hypothetical protein [Nocardia sp. NPDC051463]|uniref:hypothetical protein n=1 Tax=Nocardia sp. NPDC051463 TaxID=3154845 RepID=UPI00342B346A